MLFKEEKAYLAIANDIIQNGSTHKDRTGVGTRAVFGRTMDFDLTDGKIPMLSTRKVPTRFMPIELVWFISGDTNIKYLLDNNVNIWNSWVKPETAVYDNDPKNFIKELEKQGVIKLDENFKEVYNHMDTAAVNAVAGILTGKKVPDSRLLSGSIGDGAYGAQWRKWEDIRTIPIEDVEKFEAKGYKKLTTYSENVDGKKPIRDPETQEITGYEGIVDVVERAIVKKNIDQLQAVIDQINNNENSRRIILSAWNVGRLDQMQLPPCHTMALWNVRRAEDGTKYLTCSLVCRSQDFLVGTCANIAQYAMLTHMIAQVTGCVAERLVWFGSNVHIYDNQIELAMDHLQRLPLRNTVRVALNKDITDIDEFKPEDIKITGYENFLPPIKYPVAV